MRFAQKLSRIIVYVCLITLTLATSQSQAQRRAKKGPLRSSTAKNVQKPIKHDAQVEAASHEMHVDCEHCGSHGCDHCDVSMDSCVGCNSVTCGTVCGCIRWYGQVEYLLWWDKSTDIPALVTTSPNGTAIDNAGVVGFSSSLFGDDDLSDDAISGGRLTVGAWLVDGVTGVVGRYFATESQDATLTTDSTATPILARPFFNVFTDEEDALLLGFPNEFTGNVNASWESDVRGAEVLIRQLHHAECNYRFDLVYGYRYLGFDESLRIDNSLEFINTGNVQAGTVIDQFDAFDIENEFHGFDVGVMGHSVEGCWTLDFMAKVALGNMSQNVSINGSTVTTPAGGTPFSSTGGLLTQGSNIGEYDESSFAVIPEFTTTLSYAISPCMDVSVGYTFLYLNKVSRVSSAIDRSVNLTQQTNAPQGELRPVFQVDETEYWLQGLNFGLSMRF